MEGFGGAGRTFDLATARRWVALARAALAAHRAEIDALNVFPVADGDTGTNMYLTVDEAVDAVRRAGAVTDLASAASELAKASLLAARGNSGVILSQVIRGVAEVIVEATQPRRAPAAAADFAVEDAPGPPGSVSAATLAAALRRASDLARQSVTRPVEGTILTVAAAVAAAAETAAAQPASTVADVARAAVAAGRRALSATPGQLPALAAAGVVDAGGAGYLVVLESLERAIHATAPGPGLPSAPENPGSVRDAGLRTAPSLGREHPEDLHRPAGASAAPASEAASGPAYETAAGPAYEVMFLLADASQEAVETLRARLDRLGDSVLVVGSPDLWNVHVHVDDAGAAIEAGIEAGRPHRIVVSALTDRGHPADAGPLGHADAAHRVHRGLAVVAGATGDGLTRLLRAAGATVVTSGPGRRASTAELLRAAQSTGAADVVILPGDADTLLAAQAAAQVAAEHRVAVHVVDSTSPVQVLAAMAVFDRDACRASCVETLSAAVAATREGAVTVATRGAVTAAGPCRPGDVLGLSGGQVVVVGHDLVFVAGEVLARLLDAGGELVTLVLGVGAPPDLGRQVGRELVRRGHSQPEISVVEGGQPVYPLLIGVE